MFIIQYAEMLMLVRHNLDVRLIDESFGRLYKFTIALLYDL